MSRRGVRATARLCVENALFLVDERSYRAFHRWLGRRDQRRFDREFGTDTAWSNDVDDVAVESGVTGFEPTVASEFEAIMDSLAIRHEDYTFIDVGSGKAKVLLLASAYPFRRIIGLERSSTLHRVSERNIARYARARPSAGRIESLRQDVLEYRLPPDDTVFYLFNPFDERITRAFVRRLEASWRTCRRRMTLIYYNPEQRHVFEEASFLETWVPGSDLLQGAFRIYRTVDEDSG